MGKRVADMTPEERERENEKARKRRKQRMEDETDEQRSRRLASQRERSKKNYPKRRAKMSESEHETLKDKMKKNYRIRIENETEDEKEQRQIKAREANRRHAEVRYKENSSSSSCAGGRLTRMQKMAKKKRDKYHENEKYRQCILDKGKQKILDETPDERQKRLDYHKTYYKNSRDGVPKKIRTKMGKEEVNEKAKIRQREYRARLSEEQQEEIKKHKRDRAKDDRLNNPEKYKKIDSEKYKKNKTIDGWIEKERERQRIKEKNKRDKTASDPVLKQQADAKEAKRRVERRLRQTDSCYRECPICRSKHQSKSYDQCRECRTVENGMERKEIETKRFLEENGFIPCLHDRKGPCGGGSNIRRADFVFDSHDSKYTIIIEVDEDGHRSYTPECENVRLHDLKEQYPDKPVFFIRYHPIRLSNPTARTITKRNKTKLLKALKMIFRLPSPGDNELSCGYNMLFIGYSEDRVKELCDTGEKMQEERLQHLAMETHIRREEKRLEKQRNRKK